MKRKLFTSLFAGMLLLGVGFSATSCSDTTSDFEETQWNIENFTVNASEWSWNATEKRWEASKQLKYIDEFIYESGAVIGYVFLGQQGANEVQVQLPYIKNYVVDGAAFVETIGYEYNYQTNRVTFFIQDSESAQDTDAKVTYNFRIAMIW